MPIHTLLADYANPAHAAALLDLLDGYARDRFGAGAPLAAEVRARLIAELIRRPTAFSLLAYVDSHPVGLANCFEGFSTFQARPLVNIHDVFVDPAWRGRGVVQALLAGIEHQAAARGCCKLTLEVLAANTRAQAAYRRAGFKDDTALFWQKHLPSC